MSDLRDEILLRLLKVLAAAILGVAVYWVATTLLGEPGGVTLALLSFLAGAACVLLVQESPV